MHEYSIASQMWASVVKAAQERGGLRVLSIKLEIGPLNLIADEQLRFWITALAERDGSPGVRLEIAHPPAQVRCRACGKQSEPPVAPENADHFLPPVVACASCGSADVAVLGGRELRVVSAEIEMEDSDGSD